MFALLILSIFITEPVPMDMPRADAYLVREDGRIRLEDRFSRRELWLSQTVTGRWLDESGRQFVLAKLETCPPSLDRDEYVTRTAAQESAKKMKRVRANHDFPGPFLETVSLLSPCPIVDKPREPRQLPHGYKYVYYWQHPTNMSTIVCTFLPERSDIWQMATWQLLEEDDYTLQMTAFEDKFLRHEFPRLTGKASPSSDSATMSERDLLRRDACHSVAAYDSWHATAAKEFVVLDNLSSRDFVQTLTNEFPVMRARYAASLPTPLDGKDVLCVARIFSNHDEYLDALEVEGITNLTWSGAYWSPVRRELVAYLPWNGERELLKNIRHEAFHQYLSYATAMIPASPWFNEGYAQYFEQGVEDPFVDPADLASLASLVVPVMQMGYDEFYGGTDRERALKYRIALAIVYFIEKGAPNVRFDPFKNLKQDYLKTLIETHDMLKASAAAFKSVDVLRLFVEEWTKFWESR